MSFIFYKDRKTGADDRLLTWKHTVSVWLLKSKTASHSTGKLTTINGIASKPTV